MGHLEGDVERIEKTEQTPEEFYQKVLDLLKPENKGEYTNPELALRYINETIVKYPNYGRAYTGKGLVAIQRGDYEIARASFNKAIELDPENPMHYTNKSYLFSK